MECCIKSPFRCKDDCPYKEGCDGEQIMVDALALIQQLEAQVPRWISVEERLPEPNTVVIVGGNGKVTSGIYHGTYGLWTTHDEIDFDCWMPLPQPPKE